MINLKWLATTGWLDGDKSAVQIPQSVLRDLVAEVTAARGGAGGEEREKLYQAVERVSDRILAITKYNEDPETRWLINYTLRLLEADAGVLVHLERLSAKDFMPRVKLEEAMRDAGTEVK